MESRVKVGLCRNYPSPEGRDQIHESDGSEAVELSVPGGTGHSGKSRLHGLRTTVYTILDPSDTPIITHLYGYTIFCTKSTNRKI